MFELLASSFTVGLLGSLHCAGMCGPLAVAVSCGGAQERSTAGRLAGFLSGKLATYVALGVAAGIAGSAFGVDRLGPRPFAVLAVVAGVIMVAVGVRTLWRRLAAPRTGAQGPLVTLLSAATRARTPAAPALAGVLAGLIPCGLVWAMVARSLTAGPPYAGALVMAAFGLGTVPSLAAAGWVTRVATGRTRRLGELAAASAVTVMGLLGVWRGVAALLAAAGQATGKCPGCHHGA